MPRVKGGFVTRRRRKKVLKRARGFYAGRSKQYKAASESVVRALSYATHGRKLRKRDFRKLWIMRINAAVREHDLSYSRFMFGIKAAGVELDRKVLADIAVTDPETFKSLVDTAKANLEPVSA